MGSQISSYALRSEMPFTSFKLSNNQKLSSNQYDDVQKRAFRDFDPSDALSHVFRLTPSPWEAIHCAPSFYHRP